MYEIVFDVGKVMLILFIYFVIISISAYLTLRLVKQYHLPLIAKVYLVLLICLAETIWIIIAALYTL